MTSQASSARDRIGGPHHAVYDEEPEYPIARSYVDARVQTIYGGTTEIMKEIIGRDLGLG